MTDSTPKYFDDNGTEINPDVIPFPKSGLCITCKKDGQVGEEEILCNLTRIDQQGKESFVVRHMNQENRLQDMPKHKWKFKSHFRKQAYGWKGAALASKRVREAVSEIKKVAKKDPALAGEGVVELFYRLYPALMPIDGSSGALGTAMNKTIESLLPVLIQADWDMNTRGKWLEKLYEAIIEDGWGTFDNLRDYWGEICVYSGLAHIWADEMLPVAKRI